MSNLFKYTKRVLTSVLAAAVVLTAIPSTAFGAELDEDLAIEVQDTEVAEAGEEVVEAEETEDAFAVDGASEDEVIVEGGDEEPDTSYQDFKYAITAKSTSTKFAAITISGDTASVETLTTSITDPDTATNPFYGDSVNGVEFYVVPKVGYEALAANRADAIKVEGSYKATDATSDDDAVAIPASDFVVTPVDLGETSQSGTYDCTAALKVTIKSGTWLDAYKTAYHNDHLGASAVATDSTVVKLLKIVIDDTKFTAREFPVNVVGADAGRLPEIKVAFDEDYQDETDISDAFAKAASWVGKTVRVSLVKAGKDDRDLPEKGSALANTDTTAKYHWDATNKIVTMTAKAIQDAYAASLDGWTLTFFIEDETFTSSAEITAEGSLVTFKGLNGVSNGTLEKNGTNYTATLSSTPTVAKAPLFYPFTAELVDNDGDHDSGRTLEAVMMTKDGVESLVDGFDLDAGADITDATAGSGVKYDDSVVSSGLLQDDGYYVIPKTEVTNGAKIALSAVTTEAVHFNASYASDNTSLVNIKDIYTGIIATAGTTVMSAGRDSNALTAEDYDVEITPKDGYKVDSVAVKIYDTEGSKVVTNKTLTAGDYGIYTVDKSLVTGKMIFTVTATAVSGDPVAVSKTAGSTGDIFELKNNKEVTTSPQTGIIYKGNAFDFSVEPSAVGKYVKEVSYTMTDAPEGDTGKAVLQKTDLDGTAYYRIANITGTVELDVTEATAATVYKTANPDAVITINGKELKDGQIATVPTTTDNFSFTVTTKNGAELKGVYYADLASGTAVTDLNKGAELTATAGVYKLGRTTLAGASDYLKITAVTAREASGYTVTLDSNRTPAKDNKDIKSLAMKAGYVTALASGEDLTSKYTEVTLTTTITKKDNTKITIATPPAGTAKWSLTDTAKTAEIATFVNPAAFDPTIRTTKLAGSNTVKFEYTEGFPNGTSYKKELPLTSTALSTIFSKAELFNKVAQNTGNSDPDDDDKTEVTLTDNMKTVRLDAAALNVADTMTYGVMPYVLNDEGEELPWGDDEDYVLGGSTNALGIGTGKFVKKVEYEVAPTVATTAKIKPYAAVAANMGTSGSNNGYELSTFKDVDEFDITDGLTVTATVTFQDDSTIVVTDTLNVQDNEYGYVAIPTVTLKGQAADRGLSSIELEALSTGTNSATVTFDVYKLNDAYSVVTSGGKSFADENDVQDMLDAGLIENATGVYAAPTVKKNGKNEFATVTGTSTLTITGLKKTSASVEVYPNITVDGMPAEMLAGHVAVDVFNNLESYTVTVNTKDTGAVVSGKETPLMTSGLASLRPISWIATAATKGTTSEKYEGFYLTSIKSGSKLTLPAASAFDATTINSKRSLYGWAVVPTGGGTTEYYKADGTATVTVTEDTTITALWGWNYSDGTTAGHVGLYSKVGDTYTSLATSLGDGTLDVAKGVAVETYAGYYALDVSEGPDSSGDPVYAEDPTYDATGLTYSCTSATYGGVIEAPSAGKITGKSTSGSVDLTVKWVDPKNSANEFSTYSASAPAVATDSLDVTALNVTSNEGSEYVATIGAVNGLEVSESRALALSVKVGSSSKAYGDFASVIVESSNKNVATIAKDKTSPSFSNYMINAVGTGTTNVTFKVVDAMGVESNTATAAVTVSPSAVGLVAKINGETVAEGSEMGVALGNNDLSLSLADGTTTTDSDWTVTPSDPDTTTGSDATDALAWTATTAVNPSSGVVTITATDLGIKTLTVTYTKTTGTGDSTVIHNYTREIPVRSYAAINVAGPLSSQSEDTKFEIDDAKGTAIAKDKVSTIKVPYVNGTLKKTAYEYSASLKGYTAKQLDTTGGVLEHKGWSTTNSKIKTDGSGKTLDVDAAVTGTASDWAGWGTDTVYAVFGTPGLKLSNLPSTITLTDATLTTKTGTRGTDMSYVEVGVTPATSGDQFSLEASDANKFVLKDTGDTTVALPTTGPGYAASAADGMWDGDSVDITIDKGRTPTTSRTDAFTIAKINDDDKDYVGKSTITVATPDNAKYATITVYLNGEYEFKAATASDPAVYHYMENGADIKAPAGSTVTRTVKGEAHYYDETGARVTDGIVDVNGKKVLIVGGAQRTTVGPYAVNDIGYYVGTDGFVKTGGIFAGETASDSAYSYYADETGALAKAEVVAVSGKNYFFGNDYRLAKASATANLYEQVSGTNYYTNAAGEVAMNGIFKVAGVDRLFTEAGKIVVYADTTDGKITVGGVGYVIDKDTNAATYDKKKVNAKFEWTTKKPAKFSKSNPLPTSDWKITYNLEGESEKLYANGTVTAVADPADYQTVVGLKKLTLTFTAAESDLAGYFSDSKGEKALTATPAVWTYNFSGSSDVGTGGGIEIQGLEPSYKFTGAAIKPAVTVVDNDLGITLAQGADYSVSYTNNTKLNSTATVTVNGKGNYSGKTVTETFKIVSPTEGISDLAGSVKGIAKISESFVYDGTEKYPTTIKVNTSDGEIVYQHTSGDSYTTDSTKEVGLSFANNVNAGSATVAATGADGKTKKTTFKINKVDLSAAGSKLEITTSDVEWAVKGAIPEVTVVYTPEDGAAITLIEGQDYKLGVNYADKKNVAKGNTVTITGKGTNFTKKATSTGDAGTFEITPYTLKDEDIFSVNVFQGQKAGSVKPVVLDGYGVAIPKAQYDFALINGELTVDSKAKLEAGVTYKAVVKAKEGGNLDGEATVEVEARPDISKAKVTLSDTLKKKGVEYTGEAINLENYGDDAVNFFTNGGITVQLKNASKTFETLEYGTDFEVAGYQNATKKGTMTVYIRGISEKCSGTKNFKVKISPKTMKKAE